MILFTLESIGIWKLIREPFLSIETRDHDEVYPCCSNEILYFEKVLKERFLCFQSLEFLSLDDRVVAILLYKVICQLTNGSPGSFE